MKKLESCKLSSPQPLSYFENLFFDGTKITFPSSHPVWPFICEHETALRIYARSLYKPNDPDRELEADGLILRCAYEIDSRQINFDDPAPVAQKKRRLNKNVPKKNNKMSYFKKRLQWRFRDEKRWTKRHRHEEYLMADNMDDQDAYEDAMAATLPVENRWSLEAQEWWDSEYRQDDDGDIIVYETTEGPIQYEHPGESAQFLRDKLCVYYDAGRQELMAENLQEVLRRNAPYLKRKRRGELLWKYFIQGVPYEKIKAQLRQKVLSKRAIYGVRVFLKKECAKEAYDDLRQKYKALSPYDIALRAKQIYWRDQEAEWAKEQKKLHEVSHAPSHKIEFINPVRKIKTKV